LWDARKSSLRAAVWYRFRSRLDIPQRVLYKKFAGPPSLKTMR
jgi:hypothetical protein